MIDQRIAGEIGQLDAVDGEHAAPAVEQTHDVAGGERAGLSEQALVALGRDPQLLGDLLEDLDREQLAPVDLEIAQDLTRIAAGAGERGRGAQGSGGIVGDHRFDDRMAVEISDEYRARLAEIENLLFFRNHEDARKPEWMATAARARQAAADVAAAALLGLRTVKPENYDAVRAKYPAVADSCNACHRTFAREAPAVKP